MPTEWIRADEVEAFADGWRVYDARFDEITGAVNAAASEVMPQALMADAERVREESRATVPLVWRALESGDWGSVEERFDGRGRLFATYGLDIDAWADFVLHGQQVATPMLVEAYAEDPQHLGRVLSAVQAFWRRVVGVARRRYVQTLAELAESRRIALLRSEARYRRLAESGIVGTMIADTSGRIIEANDAFLRMIDYTQEEVRAGKLRWDDLTPPGWLHVSDQLLSEVAQTGVARPREKRYRRRDGTLVPVLVGVAALEPPETITFVLDLSERQRLEEQLRQSQKLEAIGSLAGGVAHDFNNLLSVILSDCDLLLDDLERDSPLREEVEEIRRAGDRASALTAQLLAFSRKQVLRPRVIDLQSVVRGMEPLIKRLVGSPIQLHLAIRVEQARVFADPHQLEQVLMNLIVNARDAMAQGGTLTVVLEERDVDPAEAEVFGLSAQRHLVLRVSDTGQGMDKATSARVFEPFFSTKGERGTGLGLSTVFGIVRQHHGAIAVDSELGRGTTFTVFLPGTERQDEPNVAIDITADLRGPETILIVEDEADVRRVLVEVLRRNGYVVLDAPDGHEALEKASAHSGIIDLLLTDLVMPLMSGREVAQRFRELRPAARIIYMSGYSADTHFNQGPLALDAAFIAKPITPRALLEGIRAALDHSLGVDQVLAQGAVSSAVTNAT